MIFTYQITDTYTGRTIDYFLRQTGYSRRLIIDLKESPEGILLNQERAFTNALLKPGDILKIQLPKEEPSEHITPKPLPFPIIYEDEHIIALNKPADMPIHPSINNHENTLANAAAYYFKQQQIPFVFRCVNRLDRDTTGLVLLAKHQLSGCILAEAVKARAIHREYIAVCEGILKAPGTIDLPIGRLPGSAIMRCIDMEQGEHAVTHYTPIAWANNLTLLRIRLETGRTHQIRIHMGAVGHPLPGDYLYNPNYEFIKRQPLHSASLAFRHPISGQDMYLEAPVPKDMKRLFPCFFEKSLQ